MPIKPEHLDELLAGYEKPGGPAAGEEGLFKQLKKALLEAGAGRRADYTILVMRRAIPLAEGPATTATGPTPRRC